MKTLLFISTLFSALISFSQLDSLTTKEMRYDTVKEIYVDYYKYNYSLNSSQLINPANFK